ncbi:MAG: hypothetical protein HQM11_05505 [SAR324 cluster bacterium]|nr:hypothetical protein [SAR324 cluster bacterium]
MEESYKINCWQHFQCGRERGGKKVDELGECPASTIYLGHGINDGKNGGRICWSVVGTLCGGKVRGSYAQKIDNCQKCDFFKKVSREQSNFEKGEQIWDINYYPKTAPKYRKGDEEPSDD